MAYLVQNLTVTSYFSRGTLHHVTFPGQGRLASPLRSYISNPTLLIYILHTYQTVERYNLYGHVCMYVCLLAVHLQLPCILVNKSIDDTFR